MAVVQLKATETMLELVTPPTLIGTSVNYDSCKFTFGPEWGGYTKTAVFYSSRNTQTIAMLLDNENTCIIPWEPLQQNGNLYIGVFGIKDSIEIPTNFITIGLEQGAAGNNAPPPPTIAVYAQIIEQLNTAREAIALSTTNAALSATSAEQSAQNALASKDTAAEKLNEIVTENQELTDSIVTGNSLNFSLNETITAAGESKDALDLSITTAGTNKLALDDSITSAGTNKTALDLSITVGQQAKQDLESAVANAQIGNLSELNTQDKTNLVKAINENVSQLDTLTTEQLNENHIFRTLPNGKKDIISNGKFIKNVKEYTLQASQSYELITALTNVDVFKLVLTDNSPFVTDDKQKLIIQTKVLVNYSDRDNINSIGKYYISGGSPNTIFFVFAKGTTLVAAQTALVGLKLQYQLATPIEVALPNQMSENTMQIVNLTELVQGKADIAQEAWITPTLINGATVYTGSSIRYFKDNFSIVKVKGRICTSQLASVIKFPTGYLPSQSVDFAVGSTIAGKSTVRVAIAGDGNMYVYDISGTGAYISLDGISFKAEV